MSQHEALKAQVMNATRSLFERGYLSGSGGNVSVREDVQDLLAITPSSTPYEQVTQESICLVDFDLNPVECTSKPSVETAMHVAVYRNRMDVGAIVHTHQTFAKVHGLLGVPIPALTDEQMTTLGIEVAIVPYSVSGSTGLLDQVVATIANGCNAFILESHGALVLGKDMDEAVRNVVLLEKVAEAHYLALATGRPIRTLPEEMAQGGFEMLRSAQRAEARRRKKAARNV